MEEGTYPCPQDPSQLQKKKRHEHWTLVLRQHLQHDYRSQSSWNSKPEPYHEHSWTNQGQWVHIVKRKKINMN